MSTIETFGEALPGLLLESVVDPEHPDHLLLHTWNGHRATTRRKVEHGGVSYIPKNLAIGLVKNRAGTRYRRDRRRYSAWSVAFRPVFPPGVRRLLPQAIAGGV